MPGPLTMEVGRPEVVALDQGCLAGRLRLRWLGFVRRHNAYKVIHGAHFVPCGFGAICNFMSAFLAKVSTSLLFSPPLRRFSVLLHKVPLACPCLFVPELRRFYLCSKSYSIKRTFYANSTRVIRVFIS